MTATPQTATEQFIALDRKRDEAAAQQNHEIRVATQNKVSNLYNQRTQKPVGLGFNLLHLFACNVGVMIVAVLGIGVSATAVTAGAVAAVVMDAHFLTKMVKCHLAERKARKCFTAGAEVAAQQEQLARNVNPYPLWASPEASELLEKRGFKKDEMVAAFNKKVENVRKAAPVLAKKIAIKTIKLKKPPAQGLS